MLLRKINAGCSLITAMLLLDHAIFFSVWMLSRGSIAKSTGVMPWILAGVTLIHALISIDLMVSGYMDSKAHRCKWYLKLNIPVIIQRMSGILMMIFIGIHIAGAKNHFQPKMLHAVVHPLFFGVVLAHVAVSTSKSLITLGIGSAKVIKIVDIAIKILCGATFIAGVIGFYLCLFLGIVK